MTIQKFIGIKELSGILNYSKEEIQDLMDQGRIPYHTREQGAVTVTKFPLQEVLSRIKPRKKKVVKKKPSAPAKAEKK